MKPKHVMILAACLAAVALVVWPAIALLTGPATAANGRIAFGLSRDGAANIYVMDASPGANPVLLTTDPANDFNPTWSADGTTIGFVSDRDGKWEIYAMNADGSGEARITDDIAYDCTYDDTLAWSPDGSRIAFARDLQIWLMNADGTGQVPIVNDPGPTTSLNPSWSPNGTKIAFDAGTGVPGLYVMNADGSGPVRLTNNFESDQDPAWSPDGTRIAFESYRDGNWEIYVLDADGTETRLTENAARDVEPCWSPDGTKIAFVRRSTDGSGRDALYMMDADGANQVCLLDSASGSFVLRPSWGR
jgi:Tol biopolymer transport system component